MMFQTKYKYFNKQIKILLLPLILMLSLVGQHVNGSSSTIDNGTVTVSTAAPAIAVEEFASDINGRGKLMQESIADITTTSGAKKVSSTATTTETKDKSENNGTTTAIYDHINENDNNSNKLPQHVAKKGHQQPNMMYMNVKMPAPQISTSTALTMSARAIKATTTTTTEKASLPPTESLLMPKDQLNKTEYNKIPKSHEKEKSNENKLKDGHETQTIQVKSNGSKTVANSMLFDNVLNNSKAYKTSKLNLYKASAMHKASRVHGENIITNKANSRKLRPFDSLAHAQQELISQFALRLKQIPRVTYFTCKTSALGITVGNVEFIKRMYTSTPPGCNSLSLMIKIVLIDHLENKNRKRVVRPRPESPFGNWLEQVLRSDSLRQIVVLNLSCGAASRHVLEMASHQAFFNSMYHWLLLEDYVFNRQTEIDDANDIENKRNMTQADKSLKTKEIVNDSNIANLHDKKLLTSPADVVGASTSGSGADKENSITPTYTASTSSHAFKITADKSSTTLNASRARITDEDDIEIIEKFLGKLNININTELILAKRRMRAILPPIYSSTATPPPSLTNFRQTDSNDYNRLQKMDYYLLYDIWNPGLQYGGVLNISKIGNFSRNIGFQLEKWYSFTSTTRRRLNMRLARVRCLVVITHKNHSGTLEEYLTSHYDTHLDSMNRFNFALLTLARDLFNFSFILSKTSTWGYLKNGKFDGMIGALVRKEADIGGSPIFFRIERAKVIDYTARTWVARPCFLFRHPRSTDKDRIVFLQPFSNQVWLIMFACGLLTIVFLWILISLERKFVPKDSTDTMSSSTVNIKTQHRIMLHTLEEPKEPEERLAGSRRWLLICIGFFCGKPTPKPSIGLFFESLSFYIGCLCQQGVTFSTFFISGRCIVIVSLLFSFSVYQFYSASIVGTLLMEKPKTIHTLSDLTHSSLEIGIEDIVYNRDYFLRTNDPDALELYAKKVTRAPTTSHTGVTHTLANTSAGNTELPDAQRANAYRNVLHSNEAGARASTNEASHWYDPDLGVAKVKQGRFAFHVDVATAYKIIADTFSEKEICDLAEVQLFSPQKMVSIVQKGSPLRKTITYGLRRINEVGLTDYQRRVWHSPKPRCIKQLHTDDLRVDMQTFTSALLVLIFGYAVSLLILSLEIVHFKLWQQRYTNTT